MKANLFLILFFSCVVGFGQVHEKQNFSYQQANYDLVIIQLDSTVLKHAQILNNQLTSQELLDSLKQTGNSFLAFNAAPTDASGNLLGLFIKNSQLQQPLNTSTGNGNFFLKPNGFWAVEKNTFTIRSSENFNNTASYNHAVQSGPMLLVDGKINPAFDPQSANKNIRLGMGIYTKNNNKFLLVVRSQTPISFFEFASLFKVKFNCLNALYLDGGSRAMLLSPSMFLKGELLQIVHKVFLIKII